MGLAFDRQGFVHDSGGIAGGSSIDQDGAVEVSVARIDAFQLVLFNEAMFLEQGSKGTHDCLLTSNRGSNGASIGEVSANRKALTRFDAPPIISLRLRQDNFPTGMNIPNSLTLLRILLIPVYIGLLIYEKFDGALIVLAVAGVTDGLDGTIARVANQRTRLGAFLDPLADKLLLTSGFITLSIIHVIPSWVTIVVVSRDVMLLLGTAVAELTEFEIDITPTILGKGTTFLQLAYVLLVIFLSSRQIDLANLQPLLYCMVAATLLSGFHYLYRGYRRTSQVVS